LIDGDGIIRADVPFRMGESKYDVEWVDVTIEFYNGKLDVTIEFYNGKLNGVGQ